MTDDEAGLDTGGEPRWLDYQAIDALVPDERNPKDHTLDEIRASMSRFGYTEPVVVDERTGKLLSGHGRLEVLIDDLSSGAPPPDGVVERDGKWLVPVVRGVRTENDDEAAAYLVAANELTIAGGWHADRLAAILESVKTTPQAFEGTGYDQARLDVLLLSLAEPTAPAAFPSFDPSSLVTEHTCPKCGFQWSGMAGLSVQPVDPGPEPS